MERRLEGGNTGNLLLHIARVHGHIVIEKDLALADLHPFYFNNILVRIQLYVITQTNNRHNRTELQRNLPSDHNHAIQKVAALVDVRQRNDAVTKLQLDRIHLQKRSHVLRLSDLLRRRFLLVRLVLDHGGLYRTGHHSADYHKQQTESHEHHRIQRGNNAQKSQNRAHQIQYLGCAEELADQNRAEIRLLGAFRHKNTCGKRDQKRRNLAHQTVTDGKDRVFVQRIRHLHPLPYHTESNTAHDIDECDHQTRSRVSLHVLHGTIHGTEERGFFLNLFPALFRLLIRDGSGV